MKKIFAIALALVMVFAMTSAFASPCTAGFDWTNASATNCGQAKVEVVPFVKVNDGCGSYSYQVSECAAAVSSEKVYYGFKMTVDANPDKEWFESLPTDKNNTSNKVEPSVKVTYAGFKNDPAASFAGIQEAMYADTNDTEKVYFFKADTDEWKLLDETKGITMADVLKADSPYVMENEVANASKAKVCVELVAKKEFTSGIVGKYFVTWNNGLLQVWEKNGVAADAWLATYTVTDGEVSGVAYQAKSCAPYDMASIKAFFGIDVGTKLTQKLLNKNFGWDDSVKDCFAWSSKAPSVVDAECVVAIPKTGDASVLAWLF